MTMTSSVEFLSKNCCIVNLNSHFTRISSLYSLFINDFYELCTVVDCQIHLKQCVQFAAVCLSSHSTIHYLPTYM